MERSDRSGKSPKRNSRSFPLIELGFKTALVAGLWLVLSLVDAEITPSVAIATLAAIFGPDALQAGLGRLSGKT
jgi:hypothetical protein